MTAVWDTVTETYNEYITSGDPRVTQWIFMSSPVPTIVMVFAYVLIVNVIGPAWMKNKKPYDLRTAMFAYNFSLVIMYIYFIADALKSIYRSGKSLTCRISDFSDPSELRLAELGWWFYFFKLVEFADTIFFVLRKKVQQVSTLHLVHHSIVPVAVWLGFRVEPANYNYFFPVVNTIVHILMYTYYGLSALGPGIQKYLWWKKYLTTLQIVQFIMVFVYVTALTLTGCKVSKFIIYLYIFLAGLFLIMFSDYFYKTYVKKKHFYDKTRTQNSPSDLKNSFVSQNISATFEGQMLKQSLEKKIG